MNYTTLKTSVSDWMLRTDLDSKMDMFIDLFEAKVNSALRVPEMEIRSTTTPTDEYVAFPANFLELRNIQVNTSPPRLLLYAPPHKIDELRLTAGLAKYYTIVGNQFQINPSAAGTEVEISYYSRIPALSATNLSNWLIDAHENYYLIGVICQAMLYTADPRIAIMGAELNTIEATINARGRSKKYGASPLAVIPSLHAI